MTGTFSRKRQQCPRRLRSTRRHGQSGCWSGNLRQVQRANKAANTCKHMRERRRWGRPTGQRVSDSIPQAGQQASKQEKALLPMKRGPIHTERMQRRSSPPKREAGRWFTFRGDCPSLILCINFSPNFSTGGPASLCLLFCGRVQCGGRESEEANARAEESRSWRLLAAEPCWSWGEAENLASATRLSKPPNVPLQWKKVTWACGIVRTATSLV